MTIKSSQHLLTFILLIIYFVLVSCQNEECHDIVLSDQHLDPISVEYKSWEGKEVYIYIDSLGNEYPYDLTTSTEVLVSSRNTGLCEDTTRLITFETEYFLKRFTFQDKLALSYAHFVDFVEGEQDLREINLVDKFFVSLYNDSIPSAIPLSQIALLTSSKSSPYDLLAYNSERTIFHSTLMILGKTFDNVYEQKIGSPKMYYSKVNGVISFIDLSGRKLVLDRVE